MCAIKINWQDLKYSLSGLYCYAITIRNDKVLRTRAYYQLEEKKTNKTGNIILDSLIEANFANYFSCGYDENIIKYDFHINAGEIAEIYKLLSRIEFFDFSKIEQFYLFLEKIDGSIKNEIIGATVYKPDLELKNICLYFRCIKELPIDKCKDFILKLCKFYGFRYDLCLPKGDDKHFLRLIAFDFSKTVFKLKFYFQLWPGYDVQHFLEAFADSISLNVVKKIINSNGWVGGFQIAVMDSNEVTYNFYMKERKKLKI